LKKEERKKKMNKELKHLIELYKEDRYKVNSENNMDVDKENVQLQVKKGRTLLLCSCSNDTKFCNESPICRHKQFFIIFPLLNHLFRKLNSLKSFYKTGKTIDKDKEQIYEIFIDELDNLLK